MMDKDMSFEPLPDPPALPAHPEWVEIVVPWGETSPKVVQAHMDLQAPRDPQEHPTCPVYLVKWARPPKQERPARPARPERQPQTVPPRGCPTSQVRSGLPDLPDLPDLPAHPVRQTVQPRPHAQGGVGVLLAAPVNSGRLDDLPDLPASTELSAREVQQALLARLARMAPPDRLDQMVHLVAQALKGVR